MCFTPIEPDDSDGGGARHRQMTQFLRLIDVLTSETTASSESRGAGWRYRPAR
ncbi:hypothetical protein RHECNPAF_350002 [Rhizobium etli CNPAF512]|nr:hypothetical protein RHECNPAF_350002 [Rhizobium etli CNPAF512]